MVWIGDRRTMMLGGLVVLVLLGCCPQSFAHPQYTRRIRGQGLRHLQVNTTKSRKGSKGKNSGGSSGLLVSRPFFVEECSSSLLEDDVVDDDFISQEEYAAYLYGLCASSLSFCTPPPQLQTFANLVEPLQISFVEGLCMSSPGVNECLQDLMDSGEPFGYDVSSDSTFEDVGLLDICNGIYDYFLSIGQIVVSMTAGPTTSPTNSPSESGPAGGQPGNLPSTMMPSNFTETVDPSTVEPSTDTVDPSTDTVDPSTANPTMEESMEESIGSTVDSSMTEEPMDSTAPVTTFSPTSPTESPTTTAPVPTTAPPTTAAPTTAAPTTAAPTTAPPTTAPPTTASPTAADSPLAARGIGGDDENDSGGGDLPAGGIAGIALGAVAALAVLVVLAKSKQPREEA